MFIQGPGSSVCSKPGASFPNPAHAWAGDIDSHRQAGLDTAQAYQDPCGFVSFFLRFFYIFYFFILNFF